MTDRFKKARALQKEADEVERSLVRLRIKIANERLRIIQSMQPKEKGK